MSNAITIPRPLLLDSFWVFQHDTGYRQIYVYPSYLHATEEGLQNSRLGTVTNCLCALKLCNLQCHRKKRPEDNCVIDYSSNFVIPVRRLDSAETGLWLCTQVASAGTNSNAPSCYYMLDNSIVDLDCNFARSLRAHNGPLSDGKSRSVIFDTWKFHHCVQGR
jgi:hypothetical protein